MTTKSETSAQGKSDGTASDSNSASSGSDRQLRDVSSAGSTSNQHNYRSKISSIVGSPKTFSRNKVVARPPPRHRVYEPTDPWWKPPLSSWIQETNRFTMFCFVLYNTLIVLLARYTHFCGVPSTNSSSFCSDDWILLEDKVLSGLGVGMFLLLAFRANQAYDRFWEGRKVWGRLREVSRDFSRLVSFHVECHTPADIEDRRRAIGFCATFAISLKLHLRGERNIVQDLRQDKIKACIKLNYQDIANLQQARHMPQFCQDQLSYYVAKQQKEGKLSDYQLGVINTTSLAVMSDTMGSCERIRNTPIPLSYVLQLRFFLILWLAIHPLHDVALYGWWSLLLSNVVAFSVLGVESMACEIENPFGYDRNDLNLDSMVEGMTMDVHDILRRVEHVDADRIFDRETVQAMNRELNDDTTTEKPKEDV